MLATMGPTAIPVLTELLRDKEGDIRADAAEALGKIGPAAIPAATELLKGNDSDARYAAKPRPWRGSVRRPSRF